MRVLLTATSYPPAVGGAQLLMHQLARELGGRHAVQVLTQWDTNRTDWLLGTTLRAPDMGRAYDYEGVSVQQIGLAPGIRRRLAPWVLAYFLAQPLALARIAQALEAELERYGGEPEIVHNCRIGREGLSYASLRLARRRGVPFVLTPVHHPRWNTWLHRAYHALYREADAVITLTEPERDNLQQLGVRSSRIFVTGMGPVLANEAHADCFRAKHGLADAPMILFLGQKYAYKGLAAMLAAAPRVWRRAPEVRYVFVGPRTAYSRRLFRDVSDPRVVELDAVSLQAKTDALAACTALCVPSTQESFGGVYTEAWSLGKPVIAADIPAVRAVVQPGEDGLLTRPEPAAIAASILRLVKDPAAAAQMGRQGRAKVEARYTWPRLAALTEQVYAHVLH